MTRKSSSNARKQGPKDVEAYLASQPEAYPMSPAAIRAHSSELKDYEVSEGTIRFQPGKMLSPTLIEKLVKARMAEIRKGS